MPGGNSATVSTPGGNTVQNYVYVDQANNQLYLGFNGSNVVGTNYITGTSIYLDALNTIALGSFQVRSIGDVKVFEADGANTKLGFYGAAPIVRPSVTIPSGSGAAQDVLNLANAIAQLGLISLGS